MLQHLPYKTMPWVMCQNVVVKNTKMINMYLAREGVSDTFSPHHLIECRGLHYDTHFKYSFGEYVLSHVDTNPRNSMKPRAVDSIYLHPRIDTNQPGHYTMNLETGEILNPYKVTRGVLTKSHVKAVEAMGRKQGIPEFRFTGKYGDDLRDDAHSAGVEDSESENESENETEDESEAEDESENSSDEEEEEDSDDEYEEANRILANDRSEMSTDTDQEQDEIQAQGADTEENETNERDQREQ